MLIQARCCCGQRVSSSVPGRPGSFACQCMQPGNFLSVARRETCKPKVAKVASIFFSILERFAPGGNSISMCCIGALGSCAGGTREEAHAQGRAGCFL